MNLDKVMTAKAEAERFLERANEGMKALQKNQRQWDIWSVAYDDDKKTGGHTISSISSGRASLPEVAALRRASMDLTRALADLRKSP